MSEHKVLFSIFSRRCAAERVAVAAAGAFLLSGCGGGGGGALAPGAGIAALTPGAAAPVLSDTGVAPSAGRFTPNYAGDLEMLLHWTRAELGVYVEAGPDPARDQRGTTVEGIRRWEAATGGQLRFRLMDRADGADVTVRFVPTNTLGERVIGRTNTSYNAGRRTIRHADIAIDQTLSEETLLDTAVHEMGHALGISGHSADPADTMYYASLPPAFLTTPDVNTMKLAYAWLFDGQEASGRASEGGGPIKIFTIACPRP